ncbi:hypothetical protein M5K25_009422 [Dendrobium thyrsiflorum]|uniref:Uncharacterized protein n=1 Tax=Dendrobium thyrsiflorum TaxID=117978 RepID=A0ABD0V5G5_DENTH
MSFSSKTIRLGGPVIIIYLWCYLTAKLPFRGHVSCPYWKLYVCIAIGKYVVRCIKSLPPVACRRDDLSVIIHNQTSALACQLTTVDCKKVRLFLRIITFIRTEVTTFEPEATKRSSPAVKITSSLPCASSAISWLFDFGSPFVVRLRSIRRLPCLLKRKLRHFDRRERRELATVKEGTRCDTYDKASRYLPDKYKPVLDEETRCDTYDEAGIHFSRLDRRQPVTQEEVRRGAGDEVGDPKSFFGVRDGPADRLYALFSNAFDRFTGFGRRNKRKGESYLHNDQAPVVASDQNSNNNERTKEATRAISTSPVKQGSQTVMTKREDEKQTLDAPKLLLVNLINII